MGAILDTIKDVFAVFHDGTIVHPSGHAARGETDSNGGELQLQIDIKYLAERIDPAFEGFTVRIGGVADLSFTTWPRDLDAEATVMTDPAQIFAAELEILNAKVLDDKVQVICNQSDPQVAYCGGELSFRATAVEVTDESGLSHDRKALIALANGYWRDWSTKHPPATKRNVEDALPLSQTTPGVEPG